MKICLLIILLIFCGCSFSKQQKAERLVRAYLDSTLNDPHSYESVRFSKLYKLKDTVVLYKGRPDTVLYHGAYSIHHTYRAKNGFGATITRSEWFQIDSAMVTVECCFHEPFNAY